MASPLLSHPPCHLQALMDAWQPAKASLQQPLSQAVLQGAGLQRKTQKQVRLLPWGHKLAKKSRPAWLCERRTLVTARACLQVEEESLSEATSSAESVPEASTSSDASQPQATALPGRRHEPRSIRLVMSQLIETATSCEC